MTKTMAKAKTIGEEFLDELGGHRLTFQVRNEVTVLGTVESYHRGFIRLSDVTISGKGFQVPIQRPMIILDRSMIVMIY